MWFAYFLNYCDRQAVFSMLPVLKRDLFFSDAQLGLIGAAFLWTYGLCCPVAGYLADRFSKRWLVVGSLAIWSLVTTATGLAQSVMMMLLLRIAMGVSESLYMPAAIALTANAHAAHQRSRAVSILTTAQIVGSFAGSAFGGWMAGLGLWRWAFFALGGVGLLYVVPYWLFLHSQSALEAKPRSVEAAATVAVADDRKFLSPVYLLLCCVFPVFVFGLWLLYAWLPNHMYEKFNLSLAKAGVVSTLTLQLTMFIGLVTGGAVADAWSKVQRGARLWLLAISLLICAPSLHFIGNSPTVATTSLAAGVFGLMGGFFAGNIFPAAFEVVPENRRASAVGWLNFCGSMISGFAPLIGGIYKSSQGLDQLFTSTACAYLAATVCLWMGILVWYQRDYQRAL